MTLIERIEAATGPDREIDAEIWLAVVPGTTRKETRYIHGFTGKECVIDETRENFRLVTVPSYTASLDAAMTLVDTLGDAVGATFWRVGNDGEGGDPSLFKAEVLVVTSFASKQHVAVADAGALALCAAALRARQEQPA